MKVRKNPQQKLEKDAKLVAQHSEDGMTKMRLCLIFSGGHCRIGSDYQLCNNSNLDLILEVWFGIIPTTSNPMLLPGRVHTRHILHPCRGVNIPLHQV